MASLSFLLRLTGHTSCRFRRRHRRLSGRVYRPVTGAGECGSRIPDRARRTSCRYRSGRRTISIGEVLVRPDGGISYPLVGDVQVSGRTPVEVQDEIGQAHCAFHSGCGSHGGGGQGVRVHRVRAR